jgi:hypothetical protein
MATRAAYAASAGRATHQGRFLACLLEPLCSTSRQSAPASRRSTGTSPFSTAGRPTMDGRVPTFAFAVEVRSPRAAAVFRMVQAGIVHYSTSEEVDRPLSALADL